MDYEARSADWLAMAERQVQKTMISTLTTCVRKKFTWGWTPDGCVG